MPPDTAPPAPKVPIGPTTIAGYSVTLAGALGAVIAFKSGDRSEQTLGTLAAGVFAAIAFVVTQVGRYVQAREIAKGSASALNAAAASAGTAAPGLALALAAEASSPGTGTVSSITGTTGDVGGHPPQGIPPDLDDSVHALTEGDPAEPVGDPLGDEAERAPDPESDR